MREEKIKYNDDEKFDIQLSQALVNERKLGAIFENAKIEYVNLSQDRYKIELKTESWLWEKSGNLCIEYRHNGRRSGLAATQADFWVHELKRKDQTLVYIMIPVPHLIKLCHKYYGEGRYRHNAGDDGKASVILIPIREVLR